MEENDHIKSEIFNLTKDTVTVKDVACTGTLYIYTCGAHNLKYNSRCPSSISSHRYRLEIWQRDVPWSSVKQLRTVLETEYSIDDIFDTQLHFFRGGYVSERLKKDAKAKSEKAGQADGFSCSPFQVTDQNTGTALYYRELPLPW